MLHEFMHLHGLKLWNLVSFSTFLLSDAGKWLQSKWSNSSKKLQYFRTVQVESNLIFCIKNIWSVLKILDQQILEELINLKLKCSFPSHLILLYQGHNDKIGWFTSMVCSCCKCLIANFEIDRGGILFHKIFQQQFYIQTQPSCV